MGRWASRRMRYHSPREDVSTPFNGAASLVEALVGDDLGVARAAYARLRSLVVRSRHPAVRRATAAERDEIVQDIALHITREPARVAAASIYSWRGLAVAIYRWIDQTRGASIEDRPDAWGDHVWNKLGALLSRGDRFVAVREGPTARYALADRPVLDAGLDAQSLAALLPVVSPRLTSAREDQLGEVISNADLAALLERIFTAGGNVARSRTELARLVMSSLSLERGPACEPLEPHEPLERANHDGAASVEAGLVVGEARRMAEAFARSLPPRTLQAARLRFSDGDGAATLERVAHALGVSRGTAENEVGDTRGRFGAELRAWCETRSLDGEARDAFVVAVLEILAATPTDNQEDARDVH